MSKVDNEQIVFDEVKEIHFGDIDIEIDPEFQVYHFPLKSNIYDNLEKSLLERGMDNAITLWYADGKTLLLDGYHRLKICKAHPEVAMKIVYKDFPNRQKAEEYIQEVVRRQLSEREIMYMVGRAYLLETGTHGGERENAGRGEKLNSSYKTCNLKTRELIALRFGVSPSSVSNYGKFALALDKIQAIVGLDAKNTILQGGDSPKDVVSQKDVLRLAVELELYPELIAKVQKAPDTVPEILKNLDQANERKKMKEEKERKEKERKEQEEKERKEREEREEKERKEKEEREERERKEKEERETIERTTGKVETEEERREKEGNERKEREEKERKEREEKERKEREEKERKEREEKERKENEERAIIRFNEPIKHKGGGAKDRVPDWQINATKNKKKLSIRVGQISSYTKEQAIVVAPYEFYTKYRNSKPFQDYMLEWNLQELFFAWKEGPVIPPLTEDQIKQMEGFVERATYKEDEVTLHKQAYAALREQLDANRNAHGLIVGASNSQFFKCPRCGAGREYLKWTCCQDKGEMTMQDALSMLEVQIGEEMQKFSDQMKNGG